MPATPQPEDQFNTRLPTVKEFLFQNWLREQTAARGRDLSRDLHNYDLRGYWDAAGGKDTDGGHLPDTYKKPNHPTFSNESVYHGVPNPTGGTYDGGEWMGDDEEGWRFKPSLAMVSDPEKQHALRQYFSQYEPDADLEMPAPLTMEPRKAQR